MSGSGESFLFERGERVAIGTPVENDFTYVQGQLLGDGDESDLTFIEGRGIGGEFIIDDFERGDLSPYRGDTGNFAITSSVVYEGQYAVEHTGTKDGIGSFAGDGLPSYPQRGDFFALNFYLDGATANIDIGWGFEETRNVQYDHYLPDHGYYLYAGTGARPEDSAHLQINKVDGSGNDTAVSGEGSPIPESRFNEWLQFVVDWQEDGYMESWIATADDINNVVAGPVSGQDSEWSGESFWFYNDQESTDTEFDGKQYFDFGRRVQ